MKEIIIDTEITFFRYDKKHKEWVAEFTEDELKSFVKRIQKRVKGK